jgi:hypothetical protein
MTTLPPPLPRAGRIRTRIIVVVVWTVLCLATGAFAGVWLSRPRVIQMAPNAHSLSLIHPIHPVVRSESFESDGWRLLAQPRLAIRARPRAPGRLLPNKKPPDRSGGFAVTSHAIVARPHLKAGRRSCGASAVSVCALPPSAPCDASVGAPQLRSTRGRGPRSTAADDPEEDLAAEFELLRCRFLIEHVFDSEHAPFSD